MGKDSFTYRKSADLLMERFPSIGLLLGTFAIKRVEDEPLPPLDLEKEEVLYFYGLGTGKAYFESKKWLKKSPERQLVFLEDEPGVIASFLYRKESSEILSDPQVHLELFSKKKKEIELLAERFAFKRVEVAGLKSKKGVRSLRLRLLKKTALSYALRQDRMHGHQLFANFVENLQYLPTSFYANRLEGAFRSLPAIVCGAGPSLDQSIELLRRAEDRALIIAGGSALAALSSKGIIPHFGMAIDPNLEEYRRLKNSFAFEAPLLYSTRVHPGIFQTSNGPFGYLRGGIGGALELWLEEELGLLDPLMGYHIPMEATSVISVCIAWAQFLGCNPILIHGVDLAYTGNRHYAGGVRGEDTAVVFQEIDKEKSAADRIIRKKDRKGRRVLTAIRWVMESASISRFARKHPNVRFINTTSEGIGFKGICDVPLEEAIREFPIQQIRERVYEEIAKHPMPKGTQEKILEKMKELRESLSRLIGYLQILAQETKGSTALAEMELREEIAFLYLFYDISQFLKPGPNFWKTWLELARKYEKVLLG